MTLQPGEQLAHKVNAFSVLTGMRRGAHAIKEHSLGRLLTQIEAARVYHPLLIKHTSVLEFTPQWGHPVRVFV
jgi:hypothetical protein